jgi:isopenicillin N synthase-like dioxygenase
MQDRPMIPLIDSAALFAGPSAAREQADRRIHEAATGVGFLMMTGLSAAMPMGQAARRRLLRLFDLPETEIKKLWRQKFDSARSNVYRGWFPLQSGHATYKEGIDMGRDVAYGPASVDAGDPLLEATPLPPESALPGWRQDAADYYRQFEGISAALMRSLARGLDLDEHIFDGAFVGGLSTLRLIHYPPRPDDSFAGLTEEEGWVTYNGERRYVTGRPHVDTGFVTLLAQDGVEGLQARGSDGAWLDVPPLENTLAVNFGLTLERWTGGRIKATQHRVIGSGRERYSIPFFYEPRADYRIAPLPLPGIDAFEPFLYGDHLWATTTRFVEFHGLTHLRPPRDTALPVRAQSISAGGTR